MRVITLPTKSVNLVYDTDWHVSDKPPGRRTGDYREQILAKVRYTTDLANSMGAVRLCGGDVFHVKDFRNVAANSHALVTRLEEELRRAQCGTVFGVPGNHDIYMDRWDSIPTQPIGTLIASGAFTNLADESVIFRNNDGTFSVQVDAYPYEHDDMVALDRIRNAAPRDPQADYRILLVHQYGNPGDSPTMYGKPTIGFNRLADSDYDLALWGHDHSRTETVTVGNCTHVRLGSLSRASLADDEVDRDVCAAVFSISHEGVTYREHKVPVKPLEIAFVAADRQVTKVGNSPEVTRFLDAMDVAVAEVETSNEREVLYSLCPEEERSVADRACQLCSL